MPLGLGPFLDQIVTLLLLIAAAIGGIHLYKKNVNPSPPAQTQAASQRSANGNFLFCRGDSEGTLRPWRD